MTNDEGKTETRSVQAFRGMEARTIAKWEQQGWHLITQAPGKLRTELTFQRERPTVSKKALIGGAAALIVLAVIITIGVISERAGGGSTAMAPAPTAAPAQSDPRSPDVRATTPMAPASTPADLLTVKNNRDLEALLKKGDNCDDSMKTFADKYQDRTIQFDGAIAAISPHGNTKTRYDILVVPGAGDKPVGPTFQYVDVNTTSDLGWAGTDVPDSVGVGTKLRLTATVSVYAADTCLFHLNPVETAVR